MFDIQNGAGRIYIRYSKVHPRNRTWYGLRQEDLRKLEGHNAFICFLWDNQTAPLFIPLVDYEDVFGSISPASDGQYKIQLVLEDNNTELYIPKVGRFSVEGNYGWDRLQDSIIRTEHPTPDLSHSQVQTLLGAIGTKKGYEIWIPLNDRAKLDWSLAQRYECCDFLPHAYYSVGNIIQEVDVIWLHRGANQIRALYEVEHSTPIYSGLLRFNDIHLIAPTLRPTFGVVANEARQSLFAKQLKRPTFQTSGLSEMCTFLRYIDVYSWFTRAETWSDNDTGTI